jgi:DNA-directed RNA polymerase specialized sigma24 family protein
MKTQTETEKSYEKTFKRFGPEKTVNDLDYQDAVQDAVLDNILKQNENLTVAHLRHAAKQNWLDARERKSHLMAFGNFDLSQANLENEIFCRNTGEVIQAKMAISKALKPLEAEIIELYGQGYTFQEIASLKGLGSKMAVKRIYNKASKKIETLGVSYLSDFRYAGAQFRGKRDKVRFTSKPEANSLPVKRSFLCLDQSKPSVKRYKENYQGDMCPTLPPAFQVVDFVSLPFSYKTTRQVSTLSGSFWSKSNALGISRNKEFLLLIKNADEYEKMNRPKVSVKRKRPWTFGNGQFISLCGKYLNI